MRLFAEACLFVSMGLLLLSLFMLERNLRVHRFRGELLSRIHEACLADFDRGIYDWQWRYREFDRVSYNRMMMSIKRLTAVAWFDDTRFLYPMSHIEGGASL